MPQSLRTFEKFETHNHKINIVALIIKKSTSENNFSFITYLYQYWKLPYQTTLWYIFFLSSFSFHFSVFPFHWCVLKGCKPNQIHIHIESKGLDDLLRKPLSFAYSSESLHTLNSSVPRIIYALNEQFLSWINKQYPETNYCLKYCTLIVYLPLGKYENCSKVIISNQIFKENKTSF